MRSLVTCLIVFLAAISSYALTDTIPPATPQNVGSISYELHVDVTWQLNTESDLAGYKIYKWDGTAFTFLANVKKYRSFYSDWIGATSVTNKYKVAAYDLSGNVSQMSPEVTTFTHQMSDSEFLDMTQRAAFRYFWDWGDPNSGIARERHEPNESNVTNTSGGGGFGVMAIIVGIERGFITRDEGVTRMKKIVGFLTNTIKKFSGAFPHWFNGTTGDVVKFGNYQDGADIVETSFMFEGLLTARQYFNRTNSDEDYIRTTITHLWIGVDWDFFRDGSTGLYWNWSPTYGFNIPQGGTFLFHGWSETMITYFLAVASPTHPIQPAFYKSGWGNEGSNYDIRYKGGPKYGYQLQVGTDYGGPLFWTHYSYMGFDPRGRRDLYANYFVNNYNQSMINREYCIQNPKGFTGYNANCWGLTASYSLPSVYYQAHQPGAEDNGTISPTAALSAMPYFLYEKDNYSLDAIKYLYRTFGQKLWGDFGFKDAFNLTYSDAIKDNNGTIIGYKPGEVFINNYLAIDEGPIVCMIENYRSQLLWKLFMADPDVQAGLSKIPFFPSNDPSTDMKSETSLPTEFVLKGNYPNPFNPSTVISFVVPKTERVSVAVYNLLGQKVKTLFNEETSPGEKSVSWNGTNEAGDTVSSGTYIYRISAGGKFYSGKMILQK
ncbi:MAG: T9SS type A sorting domain-containing protein [Bacteroidetes bacterium]|nr:T9SS type A sorting domain-containing protein [Bacteroidota bacterium]MCL6100064.1 T9SS type A sorting domain-containing protein [Bacteroidota bacterium]